MSSVCLSKLIEKYAPMFTKVREKSSFSDVHKLKQEYAKDVGLLDGVENEILDYFKICLDTKNWQHSHLWFVAANAHPCKEYVEYILKIIQEKAPGFPRWHALDLLKHMPESLSKDSVPKLIEIVEANSLSWQKEEIEQALDTLVWIGTEEAINFIHEATKLPNEIVANRARYWLERFSENN